MKSRVYTRNIKVDFLECTVYLNFSDDVTAQRKLYGKKRKWTDEFESDSRVEALCSAEEKNPKDYFLFFRHDPSIGTVSHELYHLINKMLSYHDIHIEKFNDEVGAYLTGWLTEIICGICTELYKKKKW